MKKNLLILTITLLSINIGFSQSIDTLKLSNYLKSLESNNKFMGSVALSKNGNIVYTNQVGFADVDTKKKPNIETKYRIGSISKTFTATLVLMAVEEGKLELDETIKDYFPELINSSSITIGNLLNHRSGIHSFTNDKDYLTYNTQPKNELEMVAIISKYESDFKPNSKFEYSNSNYVLLSFILEKIYKEKFAAILSKKITEPIGLKNTYFGSKIQLENNEANSYSYLGEWSIDSETDPSISLGAGGIVSTPTDLLLFAEALFNYKIITEKSLARMQTLKDNYGMGLFKMPFYDKYTFGHNGSIDGFRSVFGYFPKEQCAFAITSNGANYEINDISIALLSALFNKPYEVPTFEVYNLKSEDLDKYLGVYSNPNFPLKISITKANNILIAQATGQSAFNLEPTDKDEFKFDQAGIVLEFDPSNNQMTLKQNGRVFKLSKE